MSGESREISAAEAAARALAALEGGEPVALVTVVRAPAREAVGRRIVVTRATAEGTLSDRALDGRAVALARRALDSGERGVQEVEGPAGLWELYVEALRTIAELLIVGAGHIARPLCRIGAMLGFRVTVIDDRPEFASREWFPDAHRVDVVDLGDPFQRITVGPDTHIVLVTRGHSYDYECLQRLLTMDTRPAYLGMIGSRRRVRAAFEALLREGIDAERLEAVHAPIGLDIAAETPEEIALAIAAEIVAVRRGGKGGKLSETERVVEKVKRDRDG